MGPRQVVFFLARPCLHRRRRALEQHVAEAVAVARRQHLKRKMTVVKVRGVECEVVRVRGVNGAGNANVLCFRF